MKTLFHNILLLSIFSTLFVSCGGNDKTKAELTKKPTNYTVLLDLSDRILAPEQLDKDFSLVETAFKSFVNHARKNLIITSKDRFSIKIIPQKNSPLKASEYEDLLNIYLDELDVKDKNNALNALSTSLSQVLNKLKKEALYGTKSSDYFGVDIWAYLHDNGTELSKTGYNTTIVIVTDGYFDFESESHVIHNKNQYTSTHFLNGLTSIDWQKEAEKKQIGLLPIKLNKDSKWIVAGISGKKASDILQTEKITYFWKKWLKQSGVISSKFILNGSKSEMSSSLIESLK